MSWWGAGNMYHFVRAFGHQLISLLSCWNNVSDLTIYASSLHPGSIAHSLRDALESAAACQTLLIASHVAGNYQRVVN